MPDKVKCAYEDAEFPETEFDDDGIHRGRTPLHYLTGVLVPRSSGGYTPLDRPAEQ